MNAQLKNRMTLILTIYVIVVMISLLLHTTHFAVGLLLLACVYTAVVLIRDYVLKVDLSRMAGLLFLYFQLLLALILCIWSESFFAHTLLLILVGECTFYQSKIKAIVFSLVNYASILLSVSIYLHFPLPREIYVATPRFIGYLAIIGISLLSKIALQQKSQLAQANRHLQAAAMELEQKSAIQERARISREIHDSVGHTLTSSLTGLQTAARALEKNNSSLAHEMIHRTMESIRSGLDDIRSIVHLLREHAPDRKFSSELTKLIEDTQKQTQVEIECDMILHMPNFTPEIELTIFRALQEGLTNGIRHGASTRFHFSLSYQDHQIRFRLTDNGKGSSQIVRGFGLNAMKERVEEAGGGLTIEKNEATAGVTLEIVIPYPPNPIERNENIG